jgi:hypothetical protein
MLDLSLGIDDVFDLVDDVLESPLDKGARDLEVLQLSLDLSHVDLVHELLKLGLAIATL